ncbi:MAG: hypothetical protein M1837_004550 [Sclerophora amabilis]|nr:MAG: hypothetical protein M1837_004550 [Sclerophora amabilis]
MNCPTRDQNIYGKKAGANPLGLREWMNFDLGLTRDPGNPTWNQSPSQLDKSLVKRSSPVACGNNRPGSSNDYDLNLHVVALLVVLFTSSLACCFPLLAVRFPRLRIPPLFLFLVRHFGTGVLIATAFVHLLPTAFVSLTDPCLPDFWTQKYPALAGAIAMSAIFLVVIIEMVFSHRQPWPSGEQRLAAEEDPERTGSLPTAAGEDSGCSHCNTAQSRRREGDSFHVSRTLSSRTAFSESKAGTGGNVFESDGWGIVGRRRNRSRSVGQGLHHVQNGRVQQDGLDGARAKAADEDRINCESRPSCSVESEQGNNEPFASKERAVAPEESQMSVGINNTVGQESAPSMAGKAEGGTSGQKGNGRDQTEPAREQDIVGHKEQKAMLQCFLLEMGILFHSVFIGMALSVTVGKDFVVLFVAIIFHQSFEGLALGSRIAVLNWKSKRRQPWLMAFAYGCTTPIGQAIGLAIHHLYDPNSQTGLLMVGIMNALSAGLLIFASVVELLAEDFLSDESLTILVGRRHFLACILVFLGAFGMSFVGAWA